MLEKFKNLNISDVIINALNEMALKNPRLFRVNLFLSRWKDMI